MKRIIHHIRKQSEENRTHVLHIIVAIAAVVLLSLWVYSLNASFTDANTVIKAKSDLKPFSALKDGIVGGYQSITNPQ